DGELLALGGRGGRHLPRLLELHALVEEQGGVAAVVHDLRGALPSPEVESALGEVPVLLEALPLVANTGTPRGLSGVPSGPTASAAAAWSWVEKMLQEAHRTSAPSAFSVSMSTAVWMVMWRLPVMRWPLSGCRPAYSLRRAMRPGISSSASRISLRPHS